MFNPEIKYIFRKKKKGFHSIENIFNSVLKSLSVHDRKITPLELSNKGGSPSTIVKNLSEIKSKKNIIYHITGDVHYMAIKTGKNTVLTIHDIQSIIRGNFFKKLYLKLFWFWLPAMRVRKITVISEFSKGELAQVIPFAKKKIIVIPNPVSPNLKYSAYAFDKSKPRILFVGTKNNKNLLRTIEALKNINCELTIIGKLTKEQSESLKVNKIDYVSEFNLNDQQMIDAYKKCDLLCFPSTYEGFGMPIIEAQATGRSVVTSDLGAMKEVAADSACLVDPYSVNSIREGLEKVIEDEVFREKLIEKGLRNVERFNISTVARQYESLYEEMAKGK